MFFVQSAIFFVGKQIIANISQERRRSIEEKEMKIQELQRQREQAQQQQAEIAARSTFHNAALISNTITKQTSQ